MKAPELISAPRYTVVPNFELFTYAHNVSGSYWNKNVQNGKKPGSAAKGIFASWNLQEGLLSNHGNGKFEMAALQVAIIVVYEYVGCSSFSQRIGTIFDIDLVLGSDQTHLIRKIRENSRSPDISKRSYGHNL